MDAFERNVGTRLLTAIAFAALLVAGCGELEQDGPKPFVKDGTYGNESAAHAPGLAERARFQDEYVLLEDKPPMTLAGGAAK